MLLWLLKQENGNRRKRCSGSLPTTYEYWTTKSGGLIFIHSRRLFQVFLAFSDQSPPFQEVITQEKTQVAGVYLALLKRLAWMSLAFYQTSFSHINGGSKNGTDFFCCWVPHWLALLRVLHVAHRQEALSWCYLAKQEKLTDWPIVIDRRSNHLQLSVGSLPDGQVYHKGSRKYVIWSGVFWTG